MSSPEARRQAHRRVIRRRRQVASAGLLAFVTLMTMAGLRLSAFANGPVAAAVKKPPAPPTISVPPTGAAPASSTSSPEPAPPSSAPESPALRPKPTGAYSRAPGGTIRHGSGTLKTYRVEVETGSGQGAPAFAAAVDAILADPSGWTSQGRWSFQRVDRDNVDLVIRLATAKTVDKVCAAVGLNTAGHLSCRSGHYVMLNLDRWLDAVREYRGDIAMYRQYVVNHEVGHQLGYGHQACPGPGHLAPVMQQQTIGLKGCRANGAPFLAGKLVSGPPAD